MYKSFWFDKIFRAEILGYDAIESKKFCRKNLHWNWAQMVIFIKKKFSFSISLIGHIAKKPRFGHGNSLGNKNWFLSENTNVMMYCCIETDVSQCKTHCCYCCSVLCTSNIEEVKLMNENRTKHLHKFWNPFIIWFSLVNVLT